jgi:hypothetical protein
MMAEELVKIHALNTKVKLVVQACGWGGRGRWGRG